MWREELPTDKGVYALHLHLEQPVDLIVGVLGQAHFPAMNYVYIGSAFGPGGVQARLGRHMMGNGNVHWHIDVLRRSANVLGGCYYVPAEFDGELRENGINKISYECRWSQALEVLPEVIVPVQGFGASDCLSGCSSHLLAFNLPRDPARSKRFRGVLMETLAESIHIKAADLNCVQVG